MAIVDYYLYASISKINHSLQIEKDGRIISENKYRLLSAREEHNTKMRKLLTDALLARSMDIRFQERAEEKREQLRQEKVAKVERIRGVRSAQSSIRS